MKRVIWALAAAAGLSGCASTGGGPMGGRGGSASNQLQTSRVQPAAQGQVRFGVTKNDNTSIDLTVKHLAQPEKLGAKETTYVVWTQRSSGAAPQNIGSLKVDDNLNGSLNTETPLRQFDLFITAEPSGQVQKPSGPKQAWTSFSR